MKDWGITILVVFFCSIAFLLGAYFKGVQINELCSTTGKFQTNKTWYCAEPIESKKGRENEKVSGQRSNA